MPWPIPPSEPRGRETLRRHYELEKTLAERLRCAPKEERRRLYGAVYDELFRRLPDLPRLADDPAALHRVVELQARALEPLIRPGAVFLEIGAGAGALALRMASRAGRVYAVEASAQAAAGLAPPENFELVVSGSIRLDMADESVDLAYSCHFLEHLHPDDALEHAAEVRRVLRPDGSYLCVTPNRIWGPHDVSRYFDDVPTGLHLREYSHGDLARLFRRAGFRRAEALGGPGPGARPARTRPVRPRALAESLLERLPIALRRRVLIALSRSRQPPYRTLEQVKVVGRV